MCYAITVTRLSLGQTLLNCPQVHYFARQKGICQSICYLTQLEQDVDKIGRVPLLGLDSSVGRMPAHLNWRWQVQILPLSVCLCSSRNVIGTTHSLKSLHLLP